jgi:hypothetical protein
MTALAEPDYYDDSDYRSELDAKYEEGFGYSPQVDDDEDDDFDDLFAGLFDDEDDDFDAVKPKAAPKKAAAKARVGTGKAPVASTVKRLPTASEVVVKHVAPRMPVEAVPEAAPAASPAELPQTYDAAPAPSAELAPEPVVATEGGPGAGAGEDDDREDRVAEARAAVERTRAAAAEAGERAKRAVSEAVAKAAAAKAAAAEASAAEQAAQEALAASAEAEQAARHAAAGLEIAVAEGASTVPVEVVSVASEAPVALEAPAPQAISADPNFAPHIAPVNQHVEFLRKLRPGFEVPYVDPMHSVEEARIVSLFSNTGEASPRGYVWAGDDAAATRLLGLQYQLGLRPEWTMPWNAYPWFTPGEANGKLTPEQLHAGLKPLLTFLKAVPRVSAIVAHGTEANRLAQMLLKTDNPLIWRRGLKVYKARSLHGRAFAGSKERQTEWLIEMGRAYADAMARAGLKSGR